MSSRWLDKWLPALCLCTVLFFQSSYACASGSAPTADPGGPYTGKSGERIQFAAQTTVTPDSPYLTYRWDFGDGGTAEGQTPIHAFLNDGIYVVTLVVHDGISDSSPATTTAVIQSQNQDPTASPGGPYSGSTSEAIHFNGSLSSDPDGTISLYTWSFGDGAYANTMDPVHIYFEEGDYSVQLTVTDNNGARHSESTTVHIKEETASNNRPDSAPTSSKQTSSSSDDTPKEDWIQLRQNLLAKKYPPATTVEKTETKEETINDTQTPSLESVQPEAITLAVEPLQPDTSLASVPPLFSLPPEPVEQDDPNPTNNELNITADLPVSVELIISFDAANNTMEVFRQRIVRKAAPKYRDRTPHPGNFLLHCMDHQKKVLESLPIQDPTQLRAEWFADTDLDHPDLLTGTVIDLPQTMFMVVVPFNEDLAQLNLMKPNFNVRGAFQTLTPIATCPLDQKALKAYVPEK